MAETPADKVFLRDARFIVSLGVTEEERANPQEISLNLSWTIDLTAAEQSDELGDTICYFGLWTLVNQLLAGRSFKLVEFLAGEIIRACFEAYPAMETMTVQVQKPGALRGQNVAFAGVEITRARGRA